MKHFGNHCRERPSWTQGRFKGSIKLTHQRGCNVKRSPRLRRAIPTYLVLRKDEVEAIRQLRMVAIDYVLYHDGSKKRGQGVAANTMTKP